MVCSADGISSGDIMIVNGNVFDGNSGHTFLSTGHSSNGLGGNLSFLVGSGINKDGENIQLRSGMTYGSENTGGSIVIESGTSSMSSSGNIHIKTANAGNDGVSGSMLLST
eukprot:12895525-Ditylum_brightwellii.AAC.1